jgi:hypothetical protein
MKTYYKIQLLLSILMIIPAIAFSQADPKANFKNQLATLFLPLDKSKITSGLLADYAVELAEIAPFNGVPSDTNYVDASTWLKLYCSIYDAQINNRISLGTPETVSNQFKMQPEAIMQFRWL